MTDRISGGAFKQMVAFGAACIAQQKQTINDLNVFPEIGRASCRERV